MPRQGKVLKFRLRILGPEQVAGASGGRRRAVVDAKLSLCVGRGFCGLTAADEEGQVEYLMRWWGATREEAEGVVFRGEVED